MKKEAIFRTILAIVAILATYARFSKNWIDSDDYITIAILVVFALAVTEYFCQKKEK